MDDWAFQERPWCASPPLRQSMITYRSALALRNWTEPSHIKLWQPPTWSVRIYFWSRSEEWCVDCRRIYENVCFAVALPGKESSRGVRVNGHGKLDTTSERASSDAQRCCHGSYMAGFGCGVAALCEADSHGRGGISRGIVDSIAHEYRVGTICVFSYQCQFLFGGSAGIDLVRPDFLPRATRQAAARGRRDSQLATGFMPRMTGGLSRHCERCAV